MPQQPSQSLAASQFETPSTRVTRSVAVITGGQGDLARILRAELLDSGYDVFSPGRDELDVRSEESVGSYFSAKVESVHLLINNAGITVDKPLVRMDEMEWTEVLDTNLRGAFLCARAVTRLMTRQRRGHIINLGSFSALSGPAGQSNYAAAKAGLIGLGQSLARELGSRNIRVNTVLPGFLETKMTANLPADVRQRALDQHALGRFNVPEDCARFLVALDSLRNISGQVFQLDSRISPWT